METRLTSLNCVPLALAVAVLAGCTSSNEPDIGTLKVSVTTDGTNRDPDGYTVRIDDQSGQPIAVNGNITINELLPAQYTVHLLGAAPNCFVTGTNPLTVAVKAGEQAVAAFTVSCTTGGSAVRVTTQLIGTDGDADGYLLKIGSGTPQRIMPQSVITLGTLEEGRLSLELTDVAAHCTPDPANPAAVTVMQGQTSPISIKVTCANITGAIQVTVVTSGSDVQRNGFGVSIDDVGMLLDSMNTGIVRKLLAGPHSIAVTPSSLQANCRITGDNPRSATVAVADTTEVTIAVTCGRMARVRVTVTTTGQDLDGDGYRVTLSDYNWYYSGDHAYDVTLPANGTVDSPSMVPGSYTVVVSELAPNCRQSLAFPNPIVVAEVDVQLTIAIQCATARQLAYVLGVGNATEIALGNETGTSVQLTSNTVADSNPAWSPDGRRLAFASARDGNSEIYTMNADGSDVRRLTTNLTADYQPAWSPDGSRIAFVSQRDGNAEVYAMNADGSSQVRLTTYTGNDAEPAWSPAGNRILFVSARSQFSTTVHVMNTDGSGVLRLTSASGEEASPTWSSTGGQVAFMRNSSSGFYLHLMQADGSQVRLVNVVTFGSTSISWHPTGQIAMTHSWCDWYYGCYSGAAIVEPIAAAVSSLPWSGSSEPAWRP